MSWAVERDESPQAPAAPEMVIMRSVTRGAEPNPPDHRPERSGLSVDSIWLWIVMTTSQQAFRVIGISGSLRRGSYNTQLLRVAAEVAPEGVIVELADISDLPLYNADIERQGLPPTVQRLRDHIAEADGVLFATPEYNYSITGALKNAIDWASRRPSPLDEKPAAIMGTGGRSGTARAQRHLRDILKHNDVQVVSQPEVALPGAWSLFSDGTISDPRSRDQIRRLLEALRDRIEEAQAA